MKTSLEGIYATGEIAMYPGQVKLSAAGLEEAPIAVNNATSVSTIYFKS